MERLRQPLALISLAAGGLLATLWTATGRPVLCHYDAFLWWLHLPAAGGALLVTWLLLRYAGLPTGACRRCGYDLRGTPRDADRCPECGAEAVAPDRHARWPRIVAGVSLLGAVCALLLTGVYGFLLFGAA